MKSAWGLGILRHIRLNTNIFYKNIHNVKHEQYGYKYQYGSTF